MKMIFFVMFRNVPECSGMFHVPDFIDAQSFHLCRLKNHEYSKPQPEKKTFSQIEEGRTSIY